MIFGGAALAEVPLSGEVSGSVVVRNPAVHAGGETSITASLGGLEFTFSGDSGAHAGGVTSIDSSIEGSIFIEIGTFGAAVAGGETSVSLAAIPVLVIPEPVTVRLATVSPPVITINHIPILIWWEHDS